MRGSESFKYFVGMLLLTGFLLAASPGHIIAEPEMSDQSIADQVEDELLFDTAVFSTNIDVTVEDGIVTLAGSVDNLLAKERAARLAGTVKGVMSVVNTVDVNPSDQRKANLIQADIEAALIADSATDAFEIDVDVTRQGEVTLSGDVESWQEKQLAAKVAKSVRGVTQLENNISVNYTRDRADTEIAAEIEKALEWSVFINSPLMIDVNVNDGVVTLNGVVSSSTEKNRAETYAWVNGVSDVKSSDLIVSQSVNQPEDQENESEDLNDQEIISAVENALFYDPRVSSFNVEVDSVYGRVTLRGTVDNLEAKRSAEQTANNTRGVTMVYNRLKVRSENQLTDAQLERKARNAIEGNIWIAEDDVTLIVVNGVADLFGTVDSTYEKNKAESLISAIEGISYVDNNMLVEDNSSVYLYDPYVDDYDPYTYSWYADGTTTDGYYQDYGYDARLSDTDIEREIESEFWWSPFVDSDEVSVSVENGEATLTGTVSTLSEKQSAAENAVEGGATSINNEITIES